MKRPFFTALICLPVVVLSLSAQAREVTFTTTLARYNGSGAYIAMYITDAQSHYQKTIWVAGKDREYYSHLKGWARGSGKKSAEYDGKTGASISSGRTLTFTQNVEEKWFDAGYQLVIDTAVEDSNSNRGDVVTPLTMSGSGHAVAGSDYVMSFQYDVR
ncbi:DUF2271 domain-containing protein [Marinomonas sp. IMCC 4694]|uniref:DUF2271 domain-containing protein n=1 Tax=Marinomonas sp. IMCC 4694 TaxID=2605432 RepID=UPI0011E760BF|nr:DUF2271 domain-containing protein [Marinomonas sp. IMCC 4694]TYL46590.1 DUF2271 domain-containing protein [Marinomonas sp. IMCC 4694]